MTHTTALSRGAMIVALGVCVLACGRANAAPQMDIVRDGKAVAVIVVRGEGDTGKDKTTSPRGKNRKSRRRSDASDAVAAATLAEWIRKITDVELPIVATAQAGKPAIYVGAAAMQAGLKLDDIKSPTREGMKVLCDGRRALLGGQCPTATVKAACRFLEELGCRYFMDHPLGQVYPRTRTLRVGKLAVTDAPGLQYRSIWGSQWTGRSLWKIWNGRGGKRLSMGHAWGKYVPDNVFEKHPEYFALRDGQRRKGQWYCTSNADLRKAFADGVIAAVARGDVNPSISPPDGRGYCQCPTCRKQDDPKVIEPSSGHVSVSNRYLDFYDAVARRVARTHPDSILNFYAYADYTQAPTLGRKVCPSLCVWIAPIRYSRHHHIGSPNSSSRMQLAELIDGWTAAVGKIGYRTYNYNLAECLVPFSKISIWAHDIPYLKRKGCIGVNLETLTNWEIYGPHIYLSIRLAYSPDADAGAIMDDYFLKFYGPSAGPIMKQYWMSIDKAFAGLKCESGSFFSLHLVYTPKFLAALDALLKKAAGAAKGNASYTARVTMATEGFRNAAQYCRLRDAMNAGKIARAAELYKVLLARCEAEQKKGLGNHYTVGYLKRFIGRVIAPAAAATSPPNKLLQRLADTWRFAWDPDNKGLAAGYAKPDFDDSKWRQVKTFSDTLHAQGLPDRKTILWYRHTLEIPKPTGRLSLLFMEVDGNATVYVNGKEVERSARKRTPFEVDISPVAKTGQNVIAVRVDHSSISELFLGGIVRPVLLIEKPADSSDP